MDTLLYFQSTATTSALGKLEGVCLAAHERGWRVHRFDLHDPVQIRNEIRYWHPIGCIVEFATDDLRLPLRTLKLVPTVLLDCNPDWVRRDVSTVIQDPSSTGRLAAEFMLELDLPFYGYVGWPEKKFWDRMRCSAFTRALRQARGTCLQIHPVSAKDVDKLQKSLVASIRDIPKPIGLYCVNDSMAAQSLDAIQTLGLSVPDDVVLLGTDNEDYICENAVPTLSSIALDFVQAGRRCVEIIGEVRSSRRQNPVHDTFGPLKVVQRSSTRRSPRPDKDVIAALDLIRSKALFGLDAKAVSQIFSCSRRMTEIRFKAVTGHTITEEIHAVQLEHAKKLLANPANKISFVPSLCGYTSTPFFHNLFRRETGMTMGEWRAAASQQNRSRAASMSRRLSAR